MSRIGRKPIVIPAGVEVKVDEAERTITVTVSYTHLTLPTKLEV